MSCALDKKGGAADGVYDRDINSVVNTVVILKLLDKKRDTVGYEDGVEGGPLLQRHILVVNDKVVVRPHLELKVDVVMVVPRWRLRPPMVWVVRPRPAVSVTGLRLGG